MTDYDYTSWQFFDAIGQASPLQDEAMNLASELSLNRNGTGNGNDPLSSENCLPCGQTSAKMGTGAHSPPVEMGTGMGMDMELEMEMFAQGMEFISVPPFPDFTLHGKKAPNTHEYDISLLHSTSHNATERALFMTPSSPSVTSPSSSSSSSSSSNQRSSPSLDLDPCTPSTTSTTSKESDEDCDWEHSTSPYFYELPGPERLPLDFLDTFQSVPRLTRHMHHQHHQHPYRVNKNHREELVKDAGAGAEELTPLEMPDGSTRFTANWLPVDPTGGFTIGLERAASVSVSHSVAASATEFGYGYGHGDRYGYGYEDVSLELEFCKEAFIQMPAPV